jgi:hypothetical protein
MKICLVAACGHALLREGSGGSDKRIALLSRVFNDVRQAQGQR